MEIIYTDITLKNQIKLNPEWFADFNWQNFSQGETVWMNVVKTLQDGIKAAAVEIGETVKAEHYMAVFTQPKPTWDSGKLKGYAAAHPEILAFRMEKNPYVSIRRVK